MPLDISSSLNTRTEVRWATLRELRSAHPERLQEAHFLESGIDRDKIPLSPDWTRYAVLEKTGTWRCVAAWRGRELVGYAGYIVDFHLQFSKTLHALNLSIYLEPSVRGICAAMIREAERGFVRRAKPGVVRIIYEAPPDSRFAALLEKLGYPTIGEVHAKVAA